MVSWPIAVSPDSPFTLANIPFGIFSTPNKVERRVGAAIGDFIIDLSVLEQSAYCDDASLTDLTIFGGTSLFRNGDLSRFASLPAATRTQFRKTLIEWLSDANSLLFNDTSRNEAVFIPMKDAAMHLPFDIRGFTDFSCADVHVDNCSRLAGVSTPPSHYCMPLGYNGRASSVVTEGEPIHRPRGIIRNPQDSSVSFGPSKKMDYEAEIGIFVSRPLPMRKTITADEANDYIFGFVVLNDWSARDIQATEMTPLGPFSGKAFATSISPWVITLDALEGARCSSTAVDLSEGGATGAQHLRHDDMNSTWDLEVEVSVFRPKSKSTAPLLTSRSNLRDLRWSPGQMLAHLASSGCGFRTGDLVGTGTVSSPNDSPPLRTLGCLLELTEGGIKSTGSYGDETLTFLEDGDEVVMSVWTAGRTVGLGTLRGELLGLVADE